MSKSRLRLDTWLVKQGIATDAGHAKVLIDKGLILVNGSIALTDNRMIANSDSVLLSTPARFVSRGGEKLEAALQSFGVELVNKRVLDVGASTGGFTDCVLQHEASEVTALDVGKSQLHDRLVRDPRVTVLDSTNARSMTIAMVGDFDVIVADLSFISLRQVATALCDVLRPHGDMILLVKPQFEAEKSEVDKGAGVIRDSEIHQRTIAQVVQAFHSQGMKQLGLIESPLRGADGNTEFLLHLRRDLLSGAHSVSGVE
jgi:23S rRNA (cytidine1920-2'-O)/16S rRNA (cytidine1409-2'-O)-methyltransferase